MENISTIYNGCANDSTKKNKFMFIILVINFKKGQKLYAAHVNMLLYNFKNKTLYRFEPHGYERSGVYDSKNINIDNALSEDLREHLPFVKYVSPAEMCSGSDYNIQDFENYNLDQNIFLATGGFCLAYSLWFLELVLLNPNLSPKVIVKYMSKTHFRNKIEHSKMIRMFVNYVLLVRDTVHKDIELSQRS